MTLHGASINKKLIVKIPKIPTGEKADEERNLNNVRLRRKSVLLDDSLYEIDEMITKHFEKNSKVVATLRSTEKIGTLSKLQVKSKELEQLEGIENATETNKNSTKKLVVNIDKMNIYESNENNQIIIKEMQNKKLKTLINKEEKAVKEIPKILTGEKADEERNLNNVRLRRKSVLLDDSLYEIDEMITKHFEKNSKVVATLRSTEKIGTLSKLQVKSKELEQLEGIKNATETNKNSTKKLVVNIDKMNIYESNENDQIIIKEMQNKKLKILINKEEKAVKEIPKIPTGEKADEERNLNNVRLRRKSVLLDDSLYEIDEMITKHFEKNSKVVATLRSTEKIGTLSKLQVKSKELEQLEGIKNATETNKNSTKKLVVNIDKINIYESNENDQIIIKEMQNKKLKILINKEEKAVKEIDKQDQPEGNIEVAQNIGKLSKHVNFEKNLPKMKENHNLRKLEPKNYEEESILDNTQEGLNKSHIELVNQQLKKKDGIPIYKKQVPEEPRNNKAEDMYEFVDSSPKTKKIDKKRRPDRSSILFDKNTHEILKKIEEKEAKAKKKVVRKKKKVFAPVPEKSYEKIIGDIVSNVKEKINNKNVNFFKQGENDVPSKDRHKNVVHLNNANNEMRIIVPCSIEVPCINGRTVPEVSNKAKYNLNNVSLRRGENAQTSDSKNSLVNNDTVTNIPHIDIVDDSMDALCSPPNSPGHDDSISENSYHDDSVVNQNDIDHCFGFDNDDYNNRPPAISTPIKLTNKGSINIIGQVVLRRGNTDVESPVDFNYRRPNANSTMVHFRSPRRSSSPWRPDWVNIKRNPHYISVKNNALPRIDQEPVLEHSFVEEFESLCTKTPNIGCSTPVNKAPVQQSILDFVGSNIEKESDVVQRSLFDYEAFNSPEKKTRKGKENQRVQEVKRNGFGNNMIVSSTPIQRKVLGDISNSSGKLIIGNTAEKDSLFGFNDTTLGSQKQPKKNGHNILDNVENDPKSKPQKPKRNGQNFMENVENDPRSKPSRFDMNVLKIYKAKDRRKKVAFCEEPKVADAPEKSISLLEISEEDKNVGEFHLFEEPEEMLDNMSSGDIAEKKCRRKRLDSCDSDESDAGKKRKKHKKTKLEIEQEKWIAEFNQMCEEVDQHELELE